MNKLIEKLKDKTYVRAFGLVTPEEQECYGNVGRENCLVYYESGWSSTPGLHGFSNLYTYAIKPKYQPEPEFVDLEIVQNTDRADKWLGVHGALLASYDFVDLHCLPSLPKFVGFHYDKETTARLEDVANLMDLKETVYARLRK